MGGGQDVDLDRDDKRPAQVPEKVWIAFATAFPSSYPSEADNGTRIRAWTTNPERVKHFREKEGLAMFEFNIVENPADSLASIASSMKRIADEVCGVPYNSTPGADNSEHRMGIVDGVMHAIEQGILSVAGRS